MNQEHDRWVNAIMPTEASPLLVMRIVVILSIASYASLPLMGELGSLE